MSLLLILFINVVVSVWGFNLDVDHPIIIENPDISQKKSYFGYSVVLYSDGEHGEKWLKIGAPNANYNYGRNETVQHSGVVYHCPYMEKCKIEEGLNYHKHNFDEEGTLADAWTGGSIDISYKYKTLATSAPNWHYFVKTPTGLSPRIRGGLFLEHFENKTLRLQSFAPLKEPDVKDDSLYYGRAQTGFSLHFVANKSELLIGAPGVYNYLGTIIRISNIEREESKWEYKIRNVGGNYLEYSGYAVTSGYFFGKDELYYATGLPRGLMKDNLAYMYGAVYVFRFSYKRVGPAHQYRTPQKAKLYGTQFGEYFGASLAAGNLNGDNLDDLIVGAPFHRSDKFGYNHGSVYVIYGHKNKFETYRENIIEGTVVDGLFGLAVMFLGDLDKDGYGEFAVSAPQEEGSGAVYIYTYNNAIKKLQIFQKIMGKEVYSDLKGFGMSFSRPYDLDGNYFSDILIGSPISGHAVLLRAKPTVYVDKSIRATKIISTSNDTLSFQCCYSYRNYLEPTLTIVRTVTVDGDHLRFRFSNDRHSEEKTIEIKRTEIFCEYISVAKVSKVINYNDSIAITLSHRIPENKTANAKNPIFITSDKPIGTDTFCKQCPLLSLNTSKIEAKQSIVWDLTCNGKKCEAELIVDANFVNLRKENTFVLGSMEHLFLKITVSNTGDPACLPFLEISLPNDVSLENKRENCDTNEVGKVICDLGDQLKNKISFEFELTIDEGIHEKELLFLVNCSTITSNRGRESSTNIPLHIEKEADFEITGESMESSYIYSKDESNSLQNTFKIEKYGPSPISEIKVNITVPYKIRDSKGVPREFAEIQEYQDKYECKNLTDPKEFYPKSSLQKTFDLPNSADASLVKNETYSLFNKANIFDINCTMENVECVHMICLVPFNNIQKYVEIGIEIKLNLDNLEDMLLSKESILITSGANIVIDNFTQTGNRSDYTEVSNLLIIEKVYRLSFWILIGSGIAGLLIFICLAVALAKAGFFERKEQQKLWSLKKEALEEEQILEAMIEREFANGTSEEENEFYGFGFLRQREPIQELYDENELYGGLLQ